MEWTTPQHEEIDLNCEISSYANAQLLNSDLILLRLPLQPAKPVNGRFLRRALSFSAVVTRCIAFLRIRLNQSGTLCALKSSVRPPAAAFLNGIAAATTAADSETAPSAVGSARRRRSRSRPIRSSGSW